jgi:hypothetical protein
MKISWENEVPKLALRYSSLLLSKRLRRPTVKQSKITRRRKSWEVTHAYIERLNWRRWPLVVAPFIWWSSVIQLPGYICVMDQTELKSQKTRTIISYHYTCPWPHCINWSYRFREKPAIYFISRAPDVTTPLSFNSSLFFWVEFCYTERICSSCLQTSTIVGRHLFGNTSLREYSTGDGWHGYFVGSY